MNAKISKTNSEWSLLDQRLDEVRLSGHDRLKAKAQMARAEAFADFVAVVWKALGRLFQGSAKAPHHPAPTAG